MATKAELQRKIVSLEQEIDHRRSTIRSLEMRIATNEELLREEKDSIEFLQARICAGDHKYVLVREDSAKYEYVCTECGKRKTVAHESH